MPTIEEAQAMLELAIELVGDEAAVRAILGVSESDFRHWRDGTALPDARAFDELLALVVRAQARSDKKKRHLMQRERKKKH